MNNRKVLLEDYDLLIKVGELEDEIERKLTIYEETTSKLVRDDLCEQISCLSRQYRALTGEYYRRVFPRK